MPTPISAAVAITAMTTVLNGKSAVFRMPNAAPVFRTCVKSTSPGTMVTLVCWGSIARIAAFVSWSIATMAIGSQISSRRAGAGSAVSPGTTAPFSVSSIDGLGQRLLAPIANPRPRRIGRNDGDVAPAPLALHARRPFDRHLRHRLGVRADVAGCRAQLHLGDDEQHRELARVALEERELRFGARQHDLRLERAADPLVLPERLDRREHLLANGRQLRPAIEQVAIDERLELRGLRKHGDVHRLLAAAGQEL